MYKKITVFEIRVNGLQMHIQIIISHELVLIIKINIPLNCHHDSSQNMRTQLFNTCWITNLHQVKWELPNYIANDVVQH